MLVIRTAVVLAWLGCLCSAAARADSATAPIPDGGEVQITLPDGWRASDQSAGPSVTVRITAAEPEQVLVLLTIIPVKEGSPVSTPEGLKALVTQLGTKALAGALQERLDVLELKNPHGAGFYYHVTDRNPEKGPGDYREAHQGALLLAGHLASFTILTHPGDTQTVEQALGSLNTLKIALPAPKT